MILKLCRGTRTSVGALLVGLSAMANAQNLAESAINDSFNALRSNGVLHLRIQGFMVRGGVSRPIRSDAWFQQEAGPNGLAKIELREQVGDYAGNWITKNRVVGDGVNLYRYNFQTLEASTIQYGSPVGDIPADYTERLFKYFSTTPALLDDFLPRMVKEIASGTESSYRRWMPGREPTLAPDNILYQQVNPFFRRFQFEFDDVGALTTVRRQEQRTVGNQVNVIDWTMEINTPTSYVPFVPTPRSDIPNWRFVSWFSAAGSGF